MEADVSVQVAHTSALDAAGLRAARELLDDVFADEMTDHDWEHALGGMHALAWESGEVIGHAAVVQRRLLHRGRALRTGYVEGVAVRADRRRRGYAGAMMDELEQVIRNAYELGALGASDDGIPFYASRGWKQWQGRTWTMTPDGVRRTEKEDGYIYVLEVPAGVDPGGDLICDWRDGELW